MKGSHTLLESLGYQLVLPFPIARTCELSIPTKCHLGCQTLPLSTCHYPDLAFAPSQHLFSSRRFHIPFCQQHSSSCHPPDSVLFPSIAKPAPHILPTTCNVSLSPTKEPKYCLPFPPPQSLFCCHHLLRGSRSGRCVPPQPSFGRDSQSQPPSPAMPRPPSWGGLCHPSGEGPRDTRVSWLPMRERTQPEFLEASVLLPLPNINWTN